MNNKEILIRNFNKAFEEKDTETILSMLTDTVVWTVIGDRTVTGKKDFKAFLEEMESPDGMKFEIFSIITHGNEVSCDGEIRIEGKGKYGFCDIYKLSGFKNPSISSMRSYIVKIE